MTFFPITLAFFCYFLHKMCEERGVSPWGYMTVFVTGFVLIMGAAFGACLFFFGANFMHEVDAQKKLESMTPFALLFQFLLFIFFRRRIEQIPFSDEEDDNMPPNDGNGKKDLSYFR